MYIADLHIHSRYSRATSKECTPEHLDLWARRKGIQIVGTGDFTHPAWREELSEKLTPAEDGLYVLKEDCRIKDESVRGEMTPRFVITGEISSIYKKNGKVRKVHSVIILPGLEASAVLWEETGNRRQKVHHIHGILGTEAMQKAAGEKAFRGSERVPAWEYRGRWDGAAVAQEITDYVRSRGCIAMYNHPLWSRVEPEEYERTQGLWGIEVFNYNTVNESGNGYDPASWDRMLHRGVRIWGTATDDNHNEGLFPDDCGGWIMVKAEVLSHEAILQGMLQGRFYGSSGPELYRWEIKNGVAAVECSPAARIDFIVGNHVGDGKTVLAPEGRTVVYAEYPLKGDEIFIRVQCTDQAGRAAWSNPFFAEQG